MMIQWFAIGWLLSKSRRVGQCFSAVSTAGDARATLVAPWHGDDGRCQRHALLRSGDDVRLCIRCRAGSPWGKPGSGRETAGIFLRFFFFGWSKIKEDNHNQESLLMPQKYWNTKNSCVFCCWVCSMFFFSQIFSYNLLTFIPRSMLFFRILRCNQASLTLQPQWSKDTPTSSGFTFIGRSMEGRSWTEGWRLFPSPDQKAWVDISLPLFEKPLLLFLIGMTIFRTLLSRAYLSCGFQFSGKLQSDIWWSPIQLEKDRNQFEVSTCFFWPGVSLTSPVVFQSGGVFKDSYILEQNDQISRSWLWVTKG